MSDPKPPPVQPSRLNSSIDDIIQLIRTLKISQIRRQLEYDTKNRVSRLQLVKEFFADAKEQQ